MHCDATVQGLHHGVTPNMIQAVSRYVESANVNERELVTPETCNVVRESRGEDVERPAKDKEHTEGHPECNHLSAIVRGGDSNLELLASVACEKGKQV